MTQREQQILDWITEDPMISQEALAERAGITRSSVAVHISNLMKKGHIVGRGYILPAGALAYLADHCTAPLLVDPVSTVKAEKVRPILGKLHTLKPNRMEAESLSGMKITDRASARRAAEKLLETGLERVFISLGEEGVFAADHQRDVWFPCCPAQMHSATGAGDAFAAALGWAFLEGKDLADSARAANAAAAIAVEGEKTINPALSADAVQQRMQEQEERI